MPGRDFDVLAPCAAHAPARPRRRRRVRPRAVRSQATRSAGCRSSSARRCASSRRGSLSPLKVHSPLARTRIGTGSCARVRISSAASRLGMAREYTPAPCHSAFRSLISVRILRIRRSTATCPTVLARAREAGVGSIVVTGTSVPESTHALTARACPSGRHLLPPPGSTRTTPANATPPPSPRCASWRSSRAWSRSANAAWTSTATTRRTRTRKSGSRRKWSWPANSESPCFCTRGMHKDKFVEVLRQFKTFRPRLRIASPARRPNCMPISTSACTSASPAGSATSGAARICCNS